MENKKQPNPWLEPYELIVSDWSESWKAEHEKEYKRLKQNGMPNDSAYIFAAQHITARQERERMAAEHQAHRLENYEN